MDRRITATLGVLLALVLWPSGSRAEDTTQTAAIAWLHDLTQAFEVAATEDKVLLICINAKNPIGEPEEPAAKALRDVVYRDAAVVERSHEFVCCLLTAGGSSDDYGELRLRLGIDGLIVSPQHIFVRPGHADGAEPLLREAYWSHGDGPDAVKALLAMFDRASAAYRVQEGVPDLPMTETGVPATGEVRTRWIRSLAGLVGADDAGLRREAIQNLVEHDQDGDGLAALVALLADLEDAEAIVDLLRALGRPGAETAAAAVHGHLAHKDPQVRGNAAVTLEYIGSTSSVEPLLGRIKREKDDGVLCHLCRALGRCGAGDGSVRKKLLRQAQPGKDGDFPSFGAVIGLAYFEGDPKVARGLEKQLLKLGSPLQAWGSSKAHPFLRASLVWSLSEICDPKSAKFLRKKILDPIADEESHQKESVTAFYGAVARKCEGRDDTQRAIDAAISSAAWDEEARALVDDCRRGRDMSRFVPKGEWNNRPKDD